MSHMAQRMDSATDIKLAVSGSTRRWRVAVPLVISLLVASNIVTLALAVYYASDRGGAPPSMSPVARQLFSVQHSIPGVEPTRVLPVANVSSPHLQRSELSYDGTPTARFMIAAGKATVYSAEGVATHEVHTEVVNGSTFGEYTGPDGRVRDRTLQIRIVKLGSDGEAILVPMSFSVTRRQATLVPNFFFFSYRPSPTAAAHNSFVSTLGPPGASLVFENDAVGPQWNELMPLALMAYAEAWGMDFLDAGGERARRLGLASYVGSKVGGYLGGKHFGSAGATLGSAAGTVAADGGKHAASTLGMAAAGYAATKLTGSSWAGKAAYVAGDVLNGEKAGHATGSIVGGGLGSSAGAVVGKTIGGVAGAALGGAVGGPVGGMVGEEAGHWAGGFAGGYIGGKLGRELGGVAGSDLDHTGIGSDVDDAVSDGVSDVKDAVGDGVSDAEGAWDGVTSGW